MSAFHASPHDCAIASGQAGRRAGGQPGSRAAGQPGSRAAGQ
ncbi:hypothetical protein [Nocardia jiangsuensis]